MQLTNTPGKLVLPFANAGAKNTIPTASQIGITAGAASLTDGFPPLTRTPIAAGGVPPSGLDMNGILYELSAIVRWANAGGGYAYDAAFAADTNVNGYPKGARIMRSDGLGYWFNTVENNTTDPEAAGAAAAGWVPDFTNGAAAVTMTSANVTLTPLQYGKPLIVISGALTANLNLIFPPIAGEWTVINNATGAFAITCKTASGTGVAVSGGCAAILYGDGTNIYSANNDVAKLFTQRIANAGGTVDAITATISPAPRTWENGVPYFIRATGANTSTTPTFTPNSGTLTAKTIVKGNGLALVAGDIAGAGHWLLMQYDATLDKVVLMNPANGIAAFRVGCFSGIAQYNANTTLTAADVGRAIAVGGSGGTMTLPLLSATKPGDFILFFCQGGTCVIAPQGSDTLYAGSGGVANLTFKGSEYIGVVNFSSSWVVCDGSWLSSAIGVGQTWQNVVGSRAIGTTYTNTTGKPIVVKVSYGLISGNGLKLTVAGLDVAWISGNSATIIYQTMEAVVPSGATYVVSYFAGSSSSAQGWVELRQ